MKNPTPRYTLASITTKDLSLLERRNNIKSRGFTDEEVYIAGIEALENKLNID